MSNDIKLTLKAAKVNMGLFQKETFFKYFVNVRDGTPTDKMTAVYDPGNTQIMNIYR